MSAGIIMLNSHDQQQHGKRGRDYEENDNSDGSEGALAGSNDYKKRRVNNYTQPAPVQLLCPVTVNNRIAEICAFYEGKVKDLTEQHERNISQKDTVYSQMQAEFSAASARQEKTVNALTDENKLLKKAVCIQEQKLREGTAVNNQLKTGLQQAVGTIGQLEATNSMLRSVIYSSNGSSATGNMGGGPNFPPGPPDVY